MLSTGREPQGLVSTRSLVGKKVLGGKSGARHIGKVRACLFHPRQKRFVGLLVKRPDAALMFHRDDLFVARGGWSVDPVTDALVVHTDEGSSGKKVLAALGVPLDECVIWDGMPLEAEDGAVCGRVGEVIFAAADGAIDRVVVDGGAAAGFLLGRREIDAPLVVGVRLFSAEKLAELGERDVRAGAIVVADEVKSLEPTGGAAERAGKAAGEAAQKAKAFAADQAPKAKVAAKVATASVKAAGEQLGSYAAKGAEAAGRQLGKTKGMFAAFKEEYTKALESDEEE